VSYCRWSSDWGECDVYVYGDVSGGYTTHVAERRLKKTVPDEVKAVKGFVESHRALCEWKEANLKGKRDKPDGPFWIDDSEFFPLRYVGPEAGESYNDPTPQECANRLRDLKAKGFNVPDYAIERLDAEAEQDGEE
jgi:hypothetical protein